MEESDLKGRAALRTEINDLLQLAGRPFVKVDTGPIPFRVRDIIGMKTTAGNMSIIEHLIVSMLRNLCIFV